VCRSAGDHWSRNTKTWRRVDSFVKENCYATTTQGSNCEFHKRERERSNCHRALHPVLFPEPIDDIGTVIMDVIVVPIH
jgi:hypothetical protein